MKMKLAVLALMALVSPGLAQTPGSYLLKDSANQPLQMGIYTNAGKSAPVSISVDALGRPLASAAGTTNPNGTALSIQGIAGGVPATVAFAAPQHVICDSGCSGGGGGGVSATFSGPIGTLGTPTGFKDASGNFQPTLGDTTNGQWVLVKNSSFAVTGTFWQATQPVSIAAPVAVTGTFFQATQPISAASLPLPTGAATQTTLASVLSALGSPFQAGGSIANTSFGATQSGAWNITNISGTISLPTGAATETTLAAINTKTPALGQALNAASVPVVLTAAQLSTLTPPAAITGFALATNQTNGSQKSQIVDGSGNVIASTSNNLNVQCANCSGSGVSTGDGSSFTAGSSLFAGGGGFFQTTATNNPLTNGQQGMFQITAQRALFSNLRNASGAEIGVSAAPIRTDPTGTTAQPVTLASTTVTGTVAVTQSGSWSLAANQSVNVAQINGVTPLMGNGVTGTGSQRVTIASDNTAFAVNATLSAEATKVIGTVRNLGSAGGVLDAIGQNVSAPANWLQIGCQFNTSPTTITSGNGSPLQCANDGSALVTVKSAVGLGQSSTTTGQTGSLIMGATTTAAPTYTTGQTNPLSLALNGDLRTVISNTGFTVSSATAPVSTMNSASANAGVTAANAFVFDDVSPTAVTENSFGYGRISANRNQYHTLRDAAGNERGQNVNANNAALVAIDQTTSGGNTTTQAASTSGGASQFQLIAANSNNSTLISAGAHNVYAVQTSNNSATIAYLKLYNKATAPTCGTDTPVKTLIIPASTSGAGSNVQIDIGASFSLGLGICVVTGIANNDNTSVAAAAYAINIDYK